MSYEVWGLETSLLWVNNDKSLCDLLSLAPLPFVFLYIIYTHTITITNFFLIILQNILQNIMFLFLFNCSIFIQSTLILNQICFYFIDHYIITLHNILVSEIILFNQLSLLILKKKLNRFLKHSPNL